MRALDGYPRVVGQDVETTELLHARSDGGFDVRGGGDVGVHEDGSFRAVLAVELLQGAFFLLEAVVVVVGFACGGVAFVARGFVQVDAAEFGAFGGEGEADGAA